MQRRYQTDLAASRFEHDYELTVLPNTRRDCGIAEFGITAPRYFFTVDFQRQSERKRLTLRVGRESVTRLTTSEALQLAEVLVRKSMRRMLDEEAGLAH